MNSNDDPLWRELNDLVRDATRNAQAVHEIAGIALEARASTYSLSARINGLVTFMQDQPAPQELAPAEPEPIPQQPVAPWPPPVPTTPGLEGMRPPPSGSISDILHTINTREPEYAPDYPSKRVTTR